MDISRKKFKDVDLSNAFFDSLKADYSEFEKWFNTKLEEFAYLFESASGTIDGFLYLKVEEGEVSDVEPALGPAKRIKVGTFKINAHGTKLGERFIKKIFDHAIHEKAQEIYVTAFEFHAPLIKIFKRYGFVKTATKTTHNGVEYVYVKSMSKLLDGPIGSYPLIKLNGQNVFLLSLYPKWHTRLLPDSILMNEDADIVQDISHTNSIHKVYLAAMSGVQNMKRGDVILIYRTSDGEGPAYYRSVVTSVCIAEDYRSINSFASQDEFLNFCRPYSVFSETELRSFWQSKRYPHIIRFSYNVALKKRVTRKVMIEECGLDANAYPGFMQLTHKQFLCITNKGQINESLIVN